MRILPTLYVQVEKQKKDLWVFCYIVNTNYTMALYKIDLAANNATFAGTLFLLAVQVKFLHKLFKSKT